MRKLILGLMLALPTITYATSDMSGVYLGVHALRSTGTTHRTNCAGHKFKDGLEGFEKGIHIKIQKDLQNVIKQNIVLGVDSAFILANTRGKRPFESLKKKNEANIGLIIGTKLNQSLVYTKVGYANSQFNFKNINKRFNYTSNKYKKRTKGIMMGLGFETPIYANWYAGAEYTYALFERKKFNIKRNEYLHCKMNTANFIGKLSYKI